MWPFKRRAPQSVILPAHEPTRERRPGEYRAVVLTRDCYDPKTYQFDSGFRAWDGEDPMGVHTTVEMLEALRKRPDIALDARVICAELGGDQKPVRFGMKQLDRAQFMEAYQQNAGQGIRMREGWYGGGSTLGHDFTPLLGGPFYKNLYFYNDYIRMHAEAFFAYHNDPFAHAITQITRDFVLGTGFEVQCDTTTPEGKLAMATWKAFEEANNLQQQIDDCCNELSIYGEVMFWKLPNNQSKITYRLQSGETAPKGLIPRVRLIDPSNIVEIVTYPEDITRPLFYVWLQPTQYQIFTAVNSSAVGGNELAGTPTQPSLKFIYQQIPAEQMLHFKINSVSNEKRGRTDYFPILEYLKRLRDSVAYAMVSLQKVSAWSIDTEVNGDIADIQAYMQSVKALGTIPDAGSEFVHSAAIKRQYLGNQHSSAHSSDVFNWCLSCISAGSGIPSSYFGTHLSGGQTRASALVATEPVAKRMEKRREVMKRILRSLWSFCMTEAGLENMVVNVIFPEIITQDRSQKLKDLLLSEQSRWIKPERAATMAAKELGITNYSYADELEDMKTELPEIPMPLVDPGVINPPASMTPGEQPSQSGGGGELSSGGSFGINSPKQTSLTSTQKRGIKQNDATL